MKLLWSDLKNYLADVSEEVLKTTVRCQEHHHNRLLNCYPIVRRDTDNDFLCLVLDFPCNFKETNYCDEELQIRENSQNRRLTYSELKQLTSLLLDHMLEKEIKAIAYNEDGSVQLIDFNNEISMSMGSNIQQDFSDGYDPYQIEHEQQPILSLTI